MADKNKYKIPDDLKKKLNSQKFRKELLQKCGKSAFVYPEKLSYPLKDETCKYRICLVHAAYVRLREFHDYKKAKEIKKILDKLENNGTKANLESSEMLFDEQVVNLM